MGFSLLAGTPMGDVVASIALLNWCGAKPAARNCFSLRGGRERRNVDQRSWRKRHLALGALSGTLIPGDWDRRLTYAAAGVMNALAAIVLLIANRPSVYLGGTAFYLATQGLCWTRSVALIVDIVGPEARDASTLYSLLNAAVTIPLLYMIWLDGLGFRRFGTHGLLGTDAALNLLVCAVVAAVFVTRGMGLRSSSAPIALRSEITGR
jgi:hypothetical protein